MKRIKFIYIRRKYIKLAIMSIIAIFLSGITLFIHSELNSINTFVDPKSGIVVVDPGHGGIDGGANKDGILEKEINLAIGIKLKKQLQEKGYTVIMTRDEDVSLDNSSKSRHQRDLNARAAIINNSNAQLFISIHVNCNIKKPSTSGAIVFYSNKFDQNKSLAYFIQRALNNISLKNKKRTIHDPAEAKYMILRNTNIPGVLVETAFISNEEEKKQLLNESFREETAKAIVFGIEQYLEPNVLTSPLSNYWSE